MQDVVFISGLGSDERLFKFIELDHCKKHFIKWEAPEANESLSSYVGKIKNQVSFTELPIIVGVSLGGIMAMELRETMRVKKTILISSIKCNSEMPVYFNWIEKVKLNEMLPPSLLKKGAPWIKPFISGTSDKTIFRIFREMLSDADEQFIHWGISKVLQWERTAYDKTNMLHIHGTGDFVFPIWNIKDCNYKIKDGGHDMIMTAPAEINKILSKEI